MKKGLFVWLLSLALATGLALGQDGAATQPEDPAGSTQEQTQETTDPAQPVDPAGETDQTEGAGEADQTADPAMGDDATDTTDPATDTTDPATDDTTDPAADPMAPDTETAAQDDAQSGQDIFAVLRSNPDFSMFADAVERAGLSETLAQQGPFTILAPTNQAFEQAGISLDQLTQDQLTTLVRNHIISGMVSADQLGTLAGVVTLLGTEYAVAPATQQPIAGGQTDGQVAGGGQAEPAEPVDPADPQDADDAEDPAAVPAEPVEQPADRETEDAAQDGPAEDDPEGEAGGAVDGEQAPGDVETDTTDAAAADRPTGEVDGANVTGVNVGEARITHAGMEAQGGVVYGINSVLVPQGLDLQGVEGGGAGTEGEMGTDTTMPGTEGEDAATDGEATGGATTDDAATDDATTGGDDATTDGAATDDGATDGAATEGAGDTGTDTTDGAGDTGTDTTTEPDTGTDDAGAGESNDAGEDTGNDTNN